MFFLLRTAFWLGLVLLILPIDVGDQNRSGESNLSAWQAIGAAQETFHDITGFCDRAPSACETGSAILSTVGQKAKASAEYLLEYMDGTEIPDSSELITGSTSQGDERGTLLNSDKIPTWKSPIPRDRPV